MCWVVPNFIQILFINRHAAYDCLFLVWFWSYVDTKLIFQMWTYLKKIFIKYIARRQYQSSLDQINSFREFLAFCLVYIRLYPTVEGKVVLHQYHQIVLEAFCEDLGAKLNDSRCIECFQSFMREVVYKQVFFICSEWHRIFGDWIVGDCELGKSIINTLIFNIKEKKHS